LVKERLREVGRRRERRRRRRRRGKRGRKDDNWKRRRGDREKHSWGWIVVKLIGGVREDLRGDGNGASVRTRKREHNSLGGEVEGSGTDEGDVPAGDDLAVGSEEEVGPRSVLVIPEADAEFGLGDLFDSEVWSHVGSAIALGEALRNHGCHSNREEWVNSMKEEALTCDELIRRRSACRTVRGQVHHVADRGSEREQILLRKNEGN
jgi:hypothetical protein